MFKRLKKRCKIFIQSAVKEELEKYSVKSYTVDESRNSGAVERTFPWQSDMIRCSESPLFEKRFNAVVDDKERKYYIDSFGLYDYHLDFINELSKRIDLKGKRVLEVGGSNFPKELVLGKVGAKQWICVDKPWIYNPVSKTNHYDRVSWRDFNEHPIDLENEPDYVIFRELSEDIPEDFFGQFDVCVSSCAVEHINNLAFTIEKICNCLKPGGQFFAMAAPIYSTFCGSHILIDKEVNHNNLPADLYFKHLLLGYSGMFCEVEKSYGKEFARKYTSEFLATQKGINRLFYEDYVFIMAVSDFSGKSVSPQWTFEPDVGTQQKLTAKYPGYKRFDVGGVVICAEK